MDFITSILKTPYGALGFFLLGVLTILHCVTMCGPLSVVVLGSKQRTTYLLQYHGSRLLSYTWLGWLLGFFQFQMDQWGLQKVLIGLIIIVLWLFFLGQSSIVLKPLFRFQSFMMKSLQTVPYKAIYLGLLTPLLPCAPLYAALAASFLAPTPFHSGLWMACFALGTMGLMILQQNGILWLSKKLSGLSKIYFYRWIALILSLLLIRMYFWHF